MSNDISVDINKISICKPVIYQNSIKVRFVIQNSLNLVIPFCPHLHYCKIQTELLFILNFPTNMSEYSIDFGYQVYR